MYSIIVNGIWEEYTKEEFLQKVETYLKNEKLIYIDIDMIRKICHVEFSI